MAGRLALLAAFAAPAALLLVALSPSASQAQTYTTEDTHTAIAAAAREHAVSWHVLDCMVRQESTYRPYARGARGEMGAAQLHPRGLYRDFLARGYDDPDNPYQAIDYLAQALTRGLASHWTSWRLCRGA